jgi:hypothetical protein
MDDLLTTDFLTTFSHLTHFCFSTLSYLATVLTRDPGKFGALVVGLKLIQIVAQTHSGVVVHYGVGGYNRRVCNATSWLNHQLAVREIQPLWFVHHNNPDSLPGLQATSSDGR